VGFGGWWYCQSQSCPDSRTPPREPTGFALASIATLACAKAVAHSSPEPVLPATAAIARVCCNACAATPRWLWPWRAKPWRQVGADVLDHVCNIAANVARIEAARGDRSPEKKPALDRAAGYGYLRLAHRISPAKSLGYIFITSSSTRQAQKRSAQTSARGNGSEC
jgi:hypothetical protein